MIDDKVNGAAGALTVLMVDDDEYILNTYKRMLRNAAFRIEAISNPVAAVQRLGEINDLAVIVSDYRMPKLNGELFLSEARRLHPDAFRIMVSSDDVPNCLDDKTVANMYIEKTDMTRSLPNAIAVGINAYNSKKKRRAV